MVNDCPPPRSTPMLEPLSCNWPLLNADRSIVSGPFPPTTVTTSPFWAPVNRNVSPPTPPSM